MASRAMDLLDEALQTAAGAVPSSAGAAEQGGAAGADAVPGAEAGSSRSFTSCQPPRDGGGLDEPARARQPSHGSSHELGSSVAVDARQASTSAAGSQALAEADYTSQVDSQSLPPCRVRRVEPNGSTEYIPPYADGFLDHGVPRQASTVDEHDPGIGAVWQPAFAAESRQRGERTRAVFRQQSAASVSSGAPSLAVADLTALEEHECSDA
eukprot:CAMPEP_0204534624 /NCGR_PEP_ID=MMETSP0661-20131031/13101_1 /ASSEMBLY_ACC=CAM_ASM_000606 /TAXON_ID=109239 /ORGANISM="Alexandrium margalefi, Strain AMGDE01CS-322" /LENGTH=210 /DNA_ID=CAMNT_0051541087 /DNA_START=55 /DNA_END=685 /DNA_ORIENTATION=-